MARIAFATWEGHPQLHEEEAQLLPALRARGFAAEAEVWSNPQADWRRYDLVVIRSTWDYHLRPGAFRAWLERLELLGVRVQNPLPLLRWNLDKLYLRDLEARGAPIVPTRFCHHGEQLSLPAEMDSRGWSEVVVKPALSANGRDTHRFHRDEALRGQLLLEELAGRGGVLLQPFLPEIVSEGEWSLLFFGGRFSHAVIKSVAPGGFLVQADHGGSARRAQPGPELLEVARRIVALAPQRPLYARVDGVLQGGRFLLLELELIEPALFLGQAPEQTERLLDAIVAVL